MNINEIIEESKKMQPSAKGGNKTCFFIGDYALLKDNYIDEDELRIKMQIEKRLREKEINIVSTLDYSIPEEDFKKRYKKGYILQEKANGVPLHKSKNMSKLSQEELETVKREYINRLSMLEGESQEFYNKFISDWIEILKARLTIDPSKTSNFYYEKGKQINFIDLGVNHREIESIDPYLACKEIATVLADGVKYNNPKMRENNPEWSRYNSLLSGIFRKMVSALEIYGVDKNKVNQILTERFPEVELEGTKFKMKDKEDKGER